MDSSQNQWGLKGIYWRQIFALDSAVIKIQKNKQKTLSSLWGFQTDSVCYPFVLQFRMWTELHSYYDSSIIIMMVLALISM